MTKATRVLVFTDSHMWCEMAGALIKCYFPEGVEFVRGKKGSVLPKGIGNTSLELVISFLSPFIIPQSILSNSKMSVNFHPGTSDYPGSGCFNFALYENATTYGAVSHHMESKVDTGEIIEEMTFPIFPHDTVESLQFRSYQTLMSLLDNFLQLYAAGEAIPTAGITWSRKPFTRRMLEKLKTLDPSSNEDEFVARFRATNYPGFPPRIEAYGQTFEVSQSDALPMAFSFKLPPVGD